MENHDDIRSEVPEGNAKSPDPSDPVSFRLTGAQGIQGVKKAVLHIRVGKPSPQDFFRVHPGEDYRLPMAVIIDKEHTETYLVSPSLISELSNDITLVELRLCVTRAGAVFIWPIVLPPADGRDNLWHKTAREIAEMAETKWVRMVSARGLGHYEAWEAPPGLLEPNWSETPFRELMKIAFPPAYVVGSVDHPLVRKLKGY